MNFNPSKIAAVLAFVIGAMAIFAGGQVLLGKIPDYYVIDWLPIYNFTIGMLTFFLTAIVIWKTNQYAIPAAVATLSVHTLVMLILQTIYRDVVAPDSIRAMTLRISVWIIILALLLVQSWKNKSIALIGQN